MIETLERRKEAMIAALWANDGFNDDKGTRQKAVSDIEESYTEAIMNITGGGTQMEEVEIDKSNPFFSAMERGMEKIHGGREYKDAEEGATVADVVAHEADFSRYIDQS